MSNNEISLVFFVGIILGIILSSFIWMMKFDNYDLRVMNGQTVKADKYFVQYSAVRRFPR